MQLLEIIEKRRSIKRFTDREITREEIEKLLEPAVLAPHHGLTEPWGFIVMAEEARRAYGQVLGRRRASRGGEPELQERATESATRGAGEPPAIVAVIVHPGDEPE